MSWDQLRLQDDADARHLRGLLEIIPAKTQGWHHLPLSRGGNFLRERWMAGDGLVLNGEYMKKPGSCWYQVEALHYQLPDAFGCLLSAGSHPLINGIGVRFWYCSGGRTVVGEGADLSFTIWQEARTVAEIPILRIPLRLPEPFELDAVRPPQDWRLELSLLGHFKSFKDSTDRRLDRALIEFRQAMLQNGIKNRVFGEYLGDGIPPESHLIELGQQDVEELDSLLTAQIQLWKSTFEEHAADMFTIFHEVIPWRKLTV